MTDAPPPPPGADPAPSTWVASRLQARFEGLDADELGGHLPEPSDPTGGLEPGAVRTGAHEQGAPRIADKAAQRQIVDLQRQLGVLRGQLDAAFDEIDQRLEAAETRASVAEARASVAEARGSVAETRATDAEARANLAHTRIDEVVAYITRDQAEDAAETGASDAQPSTPTLRGALDRLRDRLDVG
jgi:hypothetical protein